MKCSQNNGQVITNLKKCLRLKKKNEKKQKIEKVVKKFSTFLSFFFRKNVLYQQNCNQVISLMFFE